MKHLLIFIFITILFSCSTETEVNTSNFNQTLKLDSQKSSSCSAFDITKARFPENIITINPGEDIKAIIDNLSNIGTTLYFKEGVHEVTKAHYPGEGNNGLSDFFIRDMTEGIEIVGDGNCTVIRLVNIEGDDDNNVRAINILRSIDITVHDISIDGNRNNIISAPTEQKSNLFIREINKIEIFNILSTNANGDGLNIGASDNILIKDSHFDSCDRNGITFGGAGTEIPTNNITVQNCFFGENIDTSQIDFEHGFNYSNVQIENNIFQEQLPGVNSNDNRALTLFNITINPDDSVTNISSIHNNDFNHNSVLIRGCENLHFTENMDVGQTRIDRESNNIDVFKNDFKIPHVVNSTSTNPYAGIAIRQVSNTHLFVENIRVFGNDIHLLSPEIKVGITVEDADFTGIEDNLLYYDDNDLDPVSGVVSTSIGIRVKEWNIEDNEGENDLDVFLNNNYMYGFECKLLFIGNGNGGQSVPIITCTDGDGSCNSICT